MSIKVIYLTIKLVQYTQIGQTILNFVGPIYAIPIRKNDSLYVKLL